ncbi:hypothetical protein H6G89_15520 [Oscillatoria sp. FACHB-1407]|uniref:alr0857 family protein n=1 Tax=Oscillatoria sp. FACHB-1407 TaxID=2692847 RepID=UPI0016838023|nr:alr0857 family protein [Oscillatoria sp. FACHB-1407]MBD2462456.1 hypothetical protein [Oscillatoria sp. FACHB-1407]
MLKLNYTEVGLYMEWVVTSLEMAIAQRVILAMRLGQALSVEPGRASFLLPADIPELGHLEIMLHQECSGNVMITPVNDQFVEVSLSGSWVADSKESHEGMFLAVMSDGVECFIYKLWQMSEAHISSLV